MRKGFLILLLVLGTATAGLAGDFNMMPAPVLKEKIEAKAPVHILDIQVEKEFDRHHIPGAVATHAYPVKSEEDRSRLNPVIETLKADSEPVVIVCPRGEGGAKRTYEYLQAQGIEASRLFILEKGQEGWPYPELTLQSK